jgi:hypothetical protein
MPAQRIVIVLWSCGPDRPGGPVLAAAPFVYALAARALELDVEMHFTSTAVRWLVRGVADAAHTDQHRTKTVRDFIDEAQGAGVRLCACTMALAEHRRAGEALIEGVQTAGAATVIGAAAEDGTRVLVF